MLIYLLLAAMMPIWGMLWPRNKKIVIFMCCTTMFLFLALRAETLGVDLDNYSAGYNYIRGLNFSEIISRLHFFRTAELVYPFSYESGFALSMWLVAKLDFSFHGYLVIYAAFCMWSFGEWCNKYSTNAALTCLLFMCFNTFSLSFGILRQTLAMCILLWATDAIKKQNFLKFLGITALAFLFHRIAILIVPVYFFSRIALSKKRLYGCLAFCVAFLLLSPFIYSDILVQILIFMGKTSYTDGEFRMNNLIIVMFFAMLGLVIISRREYIPSDTYRMCFMAGILAVLVEILGMYNEVIARSIYILWIYVYILLPDVIQRSRIRDNRRLLNIGIYCIALVYFAYEIHGSEIVPYKFFWQ